MKRKPLSLIFMTILLLLGWVPRVTGIGDDSLWNNEILSYERANQPSLADAYVFMRDTASHPPLYSLGILRPWFSIGQNEFFQRFPSAIFGVLAIALTFALGKVAFGRKIGILGALLLAVSSLHIYYSREGRMYALLALLMTLLIYCLLKGMRHDSWKYWAGYTLFGAASLYTHYYAGFLLLAVVGYMLPFSILSFEFKRLKRWFIANLGIVVLFTPWLPAFWVQLHNDPVSHLQPVTVVQVLVLLVQFFTAFETTPLLITALIAGCVYGLVLVGLVAVAQSFRYTSRVDSDYLLLLGVVVGTIGLAVLASLFKPLIFIRYFLGIVPLVCLLLAFGLFRLRSHFIGGFLLSIVLVTSVLSSYHVVSDSWRPDYRTVLAYVKENGGPNDALVVFAPDSSSFFMAGFHHYYDSNSPIRYFYGLTPNSRALEAAIHSLERAVSGVWVVQIHRVENIIESPQDFQLVYQEKFQSRFFRGSESIGLAYLQRSRVGVED